MAKTKRNEKGKKKSTVKRLVIANLIAALALLTVTVVTPSVAPVVSLLVTSPAGLKKARRCPDTWVASFAPPRMFAWSN